LLQHINHISAKALHKKLHQKNLLSHSILDKVSELNQLCHVAMIV